MILNDAVIFTTAKQHLKRPLKRQESMCALLSLLVIKMLSCNRMIKMQGALLPASFVQCGELFSD